MGLDQSGTKKPIPAAVQAAKKMQINLSEKRDGERNKLEYKQKEEEEDEEKETRRLMMDSIPECIRKSIVKWDQYM